jgi:hypothetical protein
VKLGFRSQRSKKKAEVRMWTTMRRILGEAK